MIQTGIKLKDIVHYLKEHLSILIVVPAFIGGLWQALELMNISYSYIRFFSISQIVPDGILILIFLIIAFILIILFWVIVKITDIKNNDRHHKKINNDNDKNERKKIVSESLINFIITYCLLLFLLITLFNKPSKLTLLNSTIPILFFLFYFLNLNLTVCYKYCDDNYKKLYKFLNLPILILYIITGFYFCREIHRIFSTPDNSINIERVKSDVIKKFPNAKQEVLYFNDKYIFINIIDKSKNEKVYIAKIDELFNE